jgi:hypothetical protein
MDTLRCAHCGTRKKETEVVLIRIFKDGRRHVKNVCTLCLSRTLPNPLRKKVQLLWILAACEFGIIAYLLAYKVF